MTVVCRFRPFNEKEKAMGTKTGAVFSDDKTLLGLNLSGVSKLLESMTRDF